MKNELKQELTRRLCACNNGGLVLVMYDIYFGFSDDVKMPSCQRTGKPEKGRVGCTGGT